MSPGQDMGFFFDIRFSLRSPGARWAGVVEV